MTYVRIYTFPDLKKSKELLFGDTAKKYKCAIPGCPTTS